MRLKKLYSSREVAALTGLSARQLQWWHARGLFLPAVPPHKTEAGGFTERRYTPVALLELMVLADLRRRGFSFPSIRKLMTPPQIASVFGRRRSNHMAIKSLDSEIAVNIEQTSPSARVIPKPLTGPEPIA